MTIARWACETCGKRSPWMLHDHAQQAARWHGIRHDTDPVSIEERR